MNSFNLNIWVEKDIESLNNMLESTKQLLYLFCHPNQNIYIKKTF